MLTEIISIANLHRYMNILNPDETIGMNADRFICFGAYDEENGNGMGIACVQILPEQIRIERIYTLPEYRNRGVATALFGMMTDLPKDVDLPFTVVIYEDDPDTAFLTKHGFTELESNFSYIDGTLDQLKDLDVPAKMRKGITLFPADHVDIADLERFISTSPCDNFLQFPEYEVDMDRFSEGSIVCMQDGNIAASIMIEELNDCIQLTWFFGTDAKPIFCAFYMLKQELTLEYEPSTKIRSLIHKGRGLDAIEKMLGVRDTHNVRIYSLS